MPPEVLVFNNMPDHPNVPPYISNQQHAYHSQPAHQQQQQQQLHLQTVPNGEFQSPSFQVNQFYAEQNLFQQMQMQKLQLAQEQQQQQQQQERQQQEQARQQQQAQQQQQRAKPKKVKPVSTTPKKKRGRPPKPDSFAQRITSTMNINVNTSPLSSSPAESNSNSAARQGAPNVFTPLMRVSPTTKTKRRRKNSTTSTISNPSPGLLKKAKSFSLPSTTMLATPLSSVGTTFPNSIESQYHFNKNTLDNISMITQLQPKPTRSQSMYNSPPSAQKDGYFVPHHENLDAMKSQEHAGASSPTRKKSPDRNLLPPAMLGNPPKEKEREKEKEETKSSDDFQLKLVIDDLGKAVLASDMFNTVTSEAAIAPAPTPKPPLSQEPSRGVLRRCNSDITGSITQPKLESQLASVNENFMTNPQTPKDNYMYVSTGLTPIFNLTPQFNSLMNSVMSLNSPQYKKGGMNPFLVNQEIFTSENQQTPHQIPITLSHIQHLENLDEHPSEENELAKDPEDNASSDDSGDARLALKRVMYVPKD